MSHLDPSLDKRNHHGNLEKESNCYIQWKKEYSEIIMRFKRIIEEYTAFNRSKEIVIKYKNDKNEEKTISRRIVYTHLKEIKTDDILPIYISCGMERIPINKIKSIYVKDHIKISN